VTAAGVWAEAVVRGEVGLEAEEAAHRVGTFHRVICKGYRTEFQ
jgi:hypothetical protein